VLLTLNNNNLSLNLWPESQLSICWVRMIHLEDLQTLKFGLSCFGTCWAFWLSLALSPFMELNIIWIYWVQCSFGCRICLSIALIHGQIGLLLETFRIAFLGGRKVPVLPFMLVQCFLLKKKSFLKARNQSAQKACSWQPISTYQSRLWTLLDPSHLGNSFLRAFFLLCWSCFCWLANFFCIGFIIALHLHWDCTFRFVRLCQLQLLLLCPTVYAPAISPSQKWWPTVLEIEISCSQWEGSACYSWWAQFFSLWELFFFFFFFCFLFLVPNVFATCSHHLFMGFPKFSICSPRRSQ